MPQIEYNMSNSNDRINLPAGQRNLSAKEGWLIETAHFRVKDALRLYLEGMSKNNEWPYPPPSVSTADSPRTTLLLLVSLDSGTGTLKLMCRFITKTSGQSTGGIILLGQSRNTSEDYDDVCATFAKSFDELGTIQDDGLEDVQILFVADFKILYSLTGGFEACSNYPCIFCE